MPTKKNSQAKPNKLKGLLIKRNQKNKDLIIKEVNFLDTLTNMYNLLECDRLDIQERYINGKVYDFIIDDEYMINGKSEKPTNAVAIGTHKSKILEAIYYSLLILGQADKDGRETSLTDEDIKAILKNKKIAHTDTNGEIMIINYHFDEKDI